MGDEVQTTERDTVSIEAHNRIKQERDTFKNQLDEAARTLSGVAIVDKAYERFKGKGHPNPYEAAKAASRDQMFAGVSDDELEARLDAWFEQGKSVWGGNVPTPEVEEPVTAPSPFTPPGAARPAPSPGNTGGQVRPEPMTVSHPEVRALIKKGDKAGLRELARSGRLIASPGNPLPPGIAG